MCKRAYPRGSDAAALFEARFACARLSPDEAAALLGVSLAHYRKMESGRAPVKPLYIAALRVLGGGDLGYFGDDWAGLKVCGRHLASATERALIHVQELQQFYWLKRLR